MSSNEAFVPEKGIYLYQGWAQNNYRTSVFSFWIKKKLQWKNYEKTEMNYEEHAENLETLMRI